MFVNASLSPNLYHITVRVDCLTGQHTAITKKQVRILLIMQEFSHTKAKFP